MMGWKRAFASLILLIGVSGFDLKQEAGLFSSKTEAFAQCEDWKDEGKAIVYQVEINIAEAASRFSLDHPAPKPVSSASSVKEKLEYADKVYQWDQSVENFLAKQPKKTIKVHSRLCEYEPRNQAFIGYENKLIQEGTWKNEDGMRGHMVGVKSFRY